MSTFCNTFLYRKTIKHLHTILHNSADFVRNILLKHPFGAKSYFVANGARL